MKMTLYKMNIYANEKTQSLNHTLNGKLQISVVYWDSPETLKTVQFLKNDI